MLALGLTGLAPEGRAQDPDAFRTLDAAAAKPETAVLDEVRIAPLPKSVSFPQVEDLCLSVDNGETSAFASRICSQIERQVRANYLPPAFLAKLIWKES
ncbi:hypothetical protein [Breoghania sp.]|uniref:hypothetical protein n=1 Tax=Breoghania sp. TaxID=2065378 RepID=UPI0026369667|nr:hypothetical protein [Breoghania sp.]MDJ0932194.1 hypothetical protein [Breoghania sp.]